MYSIEVQEEQTRKTLITYEGTITPQIGDIYAGSILGKGFSQIVVGRLLIPACPKNIVVFVKDAYINE